MIKEIENLPDVSFIDDMTLDRVQAAMVEDYEEKYREITKKELKLRRGDPESLKLYAASVQIYQMYLNIEKAGRMDLLKYAYGGFLDNLGANRGVTRLPAYPAKTVVRFTLSAAMGSAITIPSGTRVSNGDQIYFATDDIMEIPIGDLYADIPCTCLTDGEAGNDLIAGAISTLVDPLPYVADVRNIETTSGGSDIESDEDFAERIYLAPSGYSVAGPRDAYIYHTKSYSPAIGDVEVISPEPCEVEIRFLMADGEMPTDAIVEEVRGHLSGDSIRPLTDRLTVLKPAEQGFDLAFTYYINRADTDKAVTIQTQVAKAVNEYITWQTSAIGRDINPSVLIQKVVEAGVKRVVVSAPEFTHVSSGSVARVQMQAVTYGGVEDD